MNTFLNSNFTRNQIEYKLKNCLKITSTYSDTSKFSNKDAQLIDAAVIPYI